MITFKKTGPANYDVFSNGRWVDSFYLLDDDSAYVSHDGKIKHTYLRVMKAAMVEIWAPKSKKLPSRHQRGLVLSAWFCEIESKWQFDVTRLGYSSSLNCAYNEAELSTGVYDEPMRLSDKDMQVIEQWQDHEADYIRLLEHETGKIDAGLSADD